MSFELVRWLFLRLLALTYLAAFASLWVQIEGLIGPEGILPAEDFLRRVEAAVGAERFLRVPTLSWWIGAGSPGLQLLCALGVAGSLALLLGFAQGPAALLAWATYLSLCGVGQAFLSFQWDGLLTETGLLALVCVPWRPLIGAPRRPTSPVALWLLRLLLFKLMFLSGWVKLASGDPTWADLSAMQFHYWTTCLPVWVGWWLHKLPDVFHHAATAATLFLELVVPFGIFLGRRLRLGAAAFLAALQLAIALTGNYGFFNLLTLTLCVTALDDRAFARVPREWLRRLRAPVAALDTGGAREPGGPARLVRHLPALLLACFVVPVSLCHFAATGGGPAAVPGWMRPIVELSRSFRASNRYGLFANMTTRRPEIIIEGSDDGVTWREYEFRWKPGDPARRPGFVQPHMPRLDWQMWFAALHDWRREHWFRAFLQRLHAGSPPVLALLERDPFAGSPPRQLRALLYQYEFSEVSAWWEHGVWWERRLARRYSPVLQR